MKTRRTVTPAAVLVGLGIAVLAVVILGPPYRSQPRPPQTSKEAHLPQANTVAQAVKAFYAAKRCYPQPTEVFGQPPSALVPYLHATTMPPYLLYVTANQGNQWVTGSGASAYLVYINYERGDATAKIYLVGSAGANSPVPSRTPVKLCSLEPTADKAQVAQATAVAQAVMAFVDAGKGCYPQPTEVLGQPPSAIVPYLHATTMPPYLLYVAANKGNQWVTGSGASTYLVYINYERGNPTANVYLVGSAGANGPVPSPTPVKLC